MASTTTTREPSSPLSSPTSSPKPRLGEAGPSRLPSVPIDDIEVDDDNSSQTSSTAQLTEPSDDGDDRDEEGGDSGSELTEDGDDGDIILPQPDIHRPTEIIAEESEEEEEELEEQVELPNNSTRRIQSGESSISDDLTPPPSGGTGPPLPLPRTSPVEEPEPMGDDEIAEEVETGEEDADGDVTMRAENGEQGEELDNEVAEESASVTGEEVGDEEEANEENASDVDEADADGREEVNPDDAVRQAEEDAADSPATPVPMRPSHSSHAPPPPPAVIRSLLQLEIKLAKLRDRLYVERMAEAAAEEEMLLNGTHPALQYLHKILAERRERLHEVASRRHHQALAELVRAREADKAHVWTSWTDERDKLHWEEFEQTWSKRRRLAREKNEIETPRIVKPVPRPGDRFTIKGADWITGATLSRLNGDEAAADLAMMENRRIQQSRNASPAVFAQHPQHSQMQYAAPPQPHAHLAYPAQTPSPNYAHRQQPQTQRPPQQQAQAYAPAVNSTASAVPVQPVLSRSGSGGSGGAAHRREGRTVPTSSDMFKRDKEVKSEALETAAPSGTGLGIWARNQDGRSSAAVAGGSGSLEARLTNGLVNGSGTPNGVSPSQIQNHLGLGLGLSVGQTNTKRDEEREKEKEVVVSGKPASQPERRFPNLSEYLGNSNPTPPGNGGTPYGSGGMYGSAAAQKVLSPPKSPGVGVGVGSIIGGSYKSSTNIHDERRRTG
ncbi:hypothetical protein BCR39DRAFT_261639 [Naematelia encephala]|uniref:Sds3-like-domain-containing protein n=1 Tax=Naematelia encephala TaxID=71784 RepID=A0A1Y2AUH5_9TREE|nr:hypothetical protein BCR39DRAFT_261639 [Naematelia encephala]